MGAFDDGFLAAARSYEKLMGGNWFEREAVRALHDNGMMEAIINPSWRGQMAELLESSAVKVFQEAERNRFAGYMELNASIHGSTLAKLVEDNTSESEMLARQAIDSQFTTFAKLLGCSTHIDELLKQINQPLRQANEMAAVFANASRIREPWLNLQDPQSSFVALDLMRGIGEALAGEDLFGGHAGKVIDDALGTWAPQDFETFANLDAQERRDLLLGEGFDARFGAIPQVAAPDALWVSGIGPRPRKARHASTTAVIRLALTPADYASAIIRRVERALRAFIASTLAARYGEQWVVMRVPREMRDRWEAVRAGRGNTSGPVSLRDSELGDLLQLIVRSEHWRDVFDARATTNRDEIQVSLSRLIAIRRPAAHSNDIGIEEFMLCATEGQRLLKAFGLSVPWRVEEQAVFESDFDCQENGN